MEEPAAGVADIGPGSSPQALAPPPGHSTVSAPAPGRKKGTACVRCRSQKVRCDNGQPACGNCSRAGQSCIRPGPTNNAGTISYLSQVEARLRWLEDALRRISPETLERAPPVNLQLMLGEPEPSGSSFQVTRPHVAAPPIPQESARGTDDQLLQGVYESTPSSTPNSTSPATSTQIKPNEPLAHEVGLLSLANSKESKYLGPSSGVPFARLIFSAIPQSQGLAAYWATPTASAECLNLSRPQPFSEDWTSEVDLQHFVDAYFETYGPLYPFLNEDVIHERLQTLFTKHSESSFSIHMPRLSEVEASLTPVHSVQIFLIIALGARTLEPRLSANFSSERYLATAMSRLDSLALHDSIEGLQIMLLLTLCSFIFVDGPNAWFLTSNIIASCLDLGFQRRWIETGTKMTGEQENELETSKNLRSGIFWSAYSLERTLAVVLGRPLTLRDEAIDVEFPGGEQSSSSPTAKHSDTAVAGSTDRDPQSSKRTRIQVPAYTASHYSFRFDRIAAEIKLTLYRVVNKPDRFPWPIDIPRWQAAVHQQCDELFDNLIRELKWRSRRSASDGAIRGLELKYHHCLMLLYRPSPAVPLPTLNSWKACYSSAIKTILISSELHRFCKLNSSWLTAHSIFVSGITFLYCLWINPNLLEEVSLDNFTTNATACSTLLEYLGKTWSVAADAFEKFERLVQMTIATWRNGNKEHGEELEVGPSLISMHQSQGWHNAQAGPILEPTNLSGQPSGDLFPANEAHSDSNLDIGSFHTELGDMSTWFDLDWIVQTRSFGDLPPLDFLDDKFSYEGRAQ
ncbi:Fc.00g086860.m01.CDS01 [Cosmosporella sp. VM-42]